MKRESADIVLFVLLAAFCVSMVLWAMAAGIRDQVAYALMVTLLLGFFFWYRARLGVPALVAAGLLVQQSFHMAGNFIRIGGVRLYDTRILPGVFEYDNFTHALGAFVVMLTLWYAVSPRLRFSASRPALALGIVVLVTAGVGTLVEIGELWAALNLGMMDRVGDYLNNAFDLVYNLLGAVLGALFILSRTWLAGSSVSRPRRGGAGARR
jgi:hypothetical protein